MKIRNGGPKLDAGAIIELEYEAGVTLPEEYKRFLLKHNGGVPEPSGFTTWDGKLESSVKEFLRLAELGEDNLLDEIVGITKAGQLPANLIPIATDPADNRIVLSTDGEDCGNVYYWAWDEEGDDHEPSYDYVRLIAHSLEEFFELLH